MSHMLTYDMAMWAIGYAISISALGSILEDYSDYMEAYGYEQSFERDGL